MSMLITGRTGFIGAEIVSQLLDEGADYTIHVAHRRGNYQEGSQRALVCFWSASDQNQAMFTVTR